MLGRILITHESTRTFETLQYIIIRGGSRTAATSKMERFVMTNPTIELQQKEAQKD